MIYYKVTYLTSVNGFDGRQLSFFSKVSTQWLSQSGSWSTSITASYFLLLSFIMSYLYTFQSIRFNTAMTLQILDIFRALCILLNLMIFQMYENQYVGHNLPLILREILYFFCVFLQLYLQIAKNHKMPLVIRSVKTCLVYDY